MSQTAAATTVAANPDNMNMELLVACELQVDSYANLRGWVCQYRKIFPFYGIFLVCLRI